jgi:hypothetical protein
MPVAKHRSPDLTWVLELPDSLKIAIADAITLYSRIESCCIEIIWELEQPDLERKKEIARNWGEQNFKLLKKAVKQIPDIETDAIWPALKALGKERNLIGHGVWLWTNEDRPLVVWHSKFLDEVDWVGAEYFDWTRFDFFMARAVPLMSLLAFEAASVFNNPHSGSRAERRVFQPSPDRRAAPPSWLPRFRRSE